MRPSFSKNSFSKSFGWLSENFLSGNFLCHPVFLCIRCAGCISFFLCAPQLNHHSFKVTGKVRRKVKPNEIEEARCHTISGSFRGSFRTALRYVKNPRNRIKIEFYVTVSSKKNEHMHDICADAMFSVILRRS